MLLFSFQLTELTLKYKYFTKWFKQHIRLNAISFFKNNLMQKCRTVGLSNCQTIDTHPFHRRMSTSLTTVTWLMWVYFMLSHINGKAIVFFHNLRIKKNTIYWDLWHFSNNISKVQRCIKVYTCRRLANNLLKLPTCLPQYNLKDSMLYCTRVS